MARPHEIWYRSSRQAFYVEIDGKQEKLAKGPDDENTRKLAQAKFHTLMAKRLTTPPVDNDDPTVVAVINAFLVHDEKRSSKRTYYERHRYLQLFTEKFGLKKVSQCKSFHLVDWIDGHDNWSNLWTRSYVIRSIKRPFNWAVDMDLIPKNPFRRVNPGSGEPRRDITIEEFNKLIVAAQARGMLHTIEAMKFLWITGCRPSEALSLRWEHIHWDRFMAVLPQHKTLHRLKQKKPRKISLAHPEIQEMLKVIRDRKDHPEYVFVSRLRRPWARNGLQQNLKRLREEIGLDEGVVIYGLRHAWATRGSKNEVPIKNVSMGMGHETTRVTEEHYTHMRDEATLHDTMLRVNGLHPGA